MALYLVIILTSVYIVHSKYNQPTAGHLTPVATNTLKLRGKM